MIDQELLRQLDRIERRVRGIGETVYVIGSATAGGLVYLSARFLAELSQAVSVSAAVVGGFVILAALRHIADRDHET